MVLDVCAANIKHTTLLWFPCFSKLPSIPIHNCVTSPCINPSKCLSSSVLISLGCPLEAVDRWQELVRGGVRSANKRHRWRSEDIIDIAVIYRPWDSWVNLKNIAPKNIFIQSSAVIKRSNHDIFYGTVITGAVIQPDFKLTTDTPYFTGELWGANFENFKENWPRFNGTALYLYYFTTLNLGR